MNLEQFTVKAREAVSEMQTIAGENGHTELAPLHLLQALLTQKQGIFFELLQRMGVSPGAVFMDVQEELKKIPEITQCHYITGGYSIFIKIFTRDNEDLKHVLSDKVQAIPGISRTETFISLEESFNRQLHLS